MDRLEEFEGDEIVADLPDEVRRELVAMKPVRTAEDHVKREPRSGERE